MISQWNNYAIHQKDGRTTGPMANACNSCRSNTHSDDVKKPLTQEDNQKDCALALENELDVEKLPTDSWGCSLSVLKTMC